MNKKTRLWCIILFSFLGTSVAMAQKSEKDRHWVWELYGGANNYMTWEIETDVVYKPWRFIGVGAGFFFTPPIDGNKTYSGEARDKNLRWQIGKPFDVFVCVPVGSLSVFASCLSES